MTIRITNEYRNIIERQNSLENVAEDILGDVKVKLSLYLTFNDFLLLKYTQSCSRSIEALIIFHVSVKGKPKKR